MLAGKGANHALFATGLARRRRRHRIGLGIGPQHDQRCGQKDQRQIADPECALDRPLCCRTQWTWPRRDSVPRSAVDVVRHQIALRGSGRLLLPRTVASDLHTVEWTLCPSLPVASCRRSGVAALGRDRGQSRRAPASPLRPCRLHRARRCVAYPSALTTRRSIQRRRRSKRVRVHARCAHKRGSDRPPDAALLRFARHGQFTGLQE